MVHIHSVQPPNHPWVELPREGPNLGAVCIYLSDDAARLAVRAVTLPKNNKADPNLETGTFGLFSTCERGFRSAVLTRGCRYIFFATTHSRKPHTGRVITGYYRLRWYAPSPGATLRDFALAADIVKFVHPPIAMNTVSGPDSESMRKHFRVPIHLSADQTAILVQQIDSLPDATIDYLDEIDRMERINLFRTGERGWRRTRPFTWNDASRYLTPKVVGTEKPLRNISPTGIWHCSNCSWQFENKALLKVCPGCDAVATLRPVA